MRSRALSPGPPDPRHLPAPRGGLRTESPFTAAPRLLTFRGLPRRSGTEEKTTPPRPRAGAGLTIRGAGRRRRRPRFPPARPRPQGAPAAPPAPVGSAADGNPVRRNAVFGRAAGRERRGRACRPRGGPSRQDPPERAVQQTEANRVEASRFGTGKASRFRDASVRGRCVRGQGGCWAGACGRSSGLCRAGALPGAYGAVPGPTPVPASACAWAPGCGSRPCGAAGLSRISHGHRDHLRW